EADGSDLLALRSLETLSESMEDWRGAVQLFEREIEVLGEREPERRRGAWLRIAELAHERLEDCERAGAAFSAPDALDPLAPPQLAAWARCLERAGQRDGFARLFARWLD